MTDQCNVQACDQDCELSEWNDWSHCSKACDGGTMARKRTVQTLASGQGNCAPDDDEQRQETRPCNNHVCLPSPTRDTMLCTAKIDVILLLDGSGSLGADGWAAVQQAGAMFASSMDGTNVKLAAQVFSGPQTWREYDACIGKDQTWVPDPETNCGIQWLSHFTDDTQGVADSIAGTAWPQKTTLTSAALAQAESELMTGREDAQSVVVVITDGKPLNKYRTKMAAQSLRKKARLIFVPVTKYDSKLAAYVEELVSKPVKENLVVLKNFDQLRSPVTMNRIIADACPTVE